MTAISFAKTVLSCVVTKSLVVSIVNPDAADGASVIAESLTIAVVRFTIVKTKL
jgi:hypothetical protein